MWEKMFSFSQRSSSCTKRKESVSMQNFPTVCKTLFLVLFTWFLSLQVYAVRLRTPQSLTIVEIPLLWILKSSSPFITATKAVSWTLWLRIYTVYIQGDTPTAAGFFVLLPLRLALLSGQTGKLHKLLLLFFFFARTHSTPYPPELHQARSPFLLSANAESTVAATACLHTSTFLRLSPTLSAELGRGPAVNLRSSTPKLLSTRQTGLILPFAAQKSCCIGDDEQQLFLFSWSDFNSEPNLLLQYES